MASLSSPLAAQKQQHNPGSPTAVAGAVTSEREMHVVSSIEEWNKGLPAQALVAKYGMLGESALSFFQGTNHLFWADLSGDPRLTKFGTTETTTWIVGDCTFASFGSSGSDAEGPMYGISSFDEAVVADYQYDLWRLGTSVALLARENAQYLLPSPKQQTPEALEALQKAAVEAMAHAYLRAVVGYRAPQPDTAAAAAPSSSSSSSSTANSRSSPAGNKTTTVGRNPSGGPAASTLSSAAASNATSSAAAAAAEAASAALRLSRVLAISGGNSKGRLVRFLAVVEREYSRRRLIRKWCGDSASASQSDRGGGGGGGGGGKLAFTGHEGRLQACGRAEEDAVVVALGSRYADGVNVKALARCVYQPHAHQLVPHQTACTTSGCAAAATCGVLRYYVLTEAANGELHVLDVRMQHRPTAYHFMNPVERRAYRHTYGRNEAQRYVEAAKALSPSSEATTGWMELKEGVHPCAAGEYSIRDISPYDETYPVLPADEAIRHKMKGFAATSKEALVELSEAWGRILGMQHALAACCIECSKANPAASGAPAASTDADAVRVAPPAGYRPALGKELARLAKAERGGFEALTCQVAISYSRQVVYDWRAFRMHLLDGDGLW